MGAILNLDVELPLMSNADTKNSIGRCHMTVQGMQKEHSLAYSKFMPTTPLWIINLEGGIVIASNGLLSEPRAY